MTITSSPAEQRILLTGITWDRYLAILGEDEHDGRMAYNQGLLEIMTVGPEHESLKQLISRLLEHYTFLRDIDIRSMGSVTMQREELEKGIEADDCYYIQSLGTVRDFMSLELPEDPAPDLALEIDITNPSFSKLGIYAALGVGEVWQYQRDHLVVLIRRDDTSYVPSETSQCLPGFPLEAVPLAVDQLRRGWSDNRILKHFAAGLDD